MRVQRRVAIGWLAVVIALFARPVTAADGGETHLKTGDKAPQFGPVKLHNGAEAGMQTFVLGKYAGDEPEGATKGVLISFFATWCGPCKKELPFLVELDAKYRAKGLQVVSISIDKDEEAFKQVRELVEKNKIAFPVVMDRYNLLARRYLGEKTALPSVFLLSRDGTISMVKQGYGDDASAFLTAEVEKILKG